MKAKVYKIPCCCEISNRNVGFLQYPRLSFFMELDPKETLTSLPGSSKWQRALSRRICPHGPYEKCIGNARSSISAVC